MAPLKSPEERDQILLLLFRESDREPLVIEADHVGQGGSGTVVKIRRPRRQRAQYRPLELSDILPLSGDQAAADTVVRTTAPVILCRSVYSGISGVRRLSSASPIFSAIATE